MATYVTGPVKSVGGLLANGTIEFKSPVLRESAAGDATIDLVSHTTKIIDGAFSTPVEAGPVVIVLKIGTTTKVIRDITIPNTESGTVTFHQLISQQTTYTPAVVNAVHADRIATEAARDAAIEAAQSAGKSAYEIAVIQGYTGTQAEWVASLEGPEGLSAYQVAVADGFTGTQAEWVESLVSTVPGPSAYEVAVDEGFVGTEAEWIASLEGPKGDRGDGIAIDVRVPTYADLPASPTNGFSAFVDEDGKLYIYDAGWPADGAGIPIVGPKGEGYLAEDPERPGVFEFESAPSVEAAAAAALAGAEGFKDDAEGFAAAAGGHATDALAHKTAAELAETNAETAQGLAETARTGAEAAQDAAEAAAAQAAAGTVADGAVTNAKVAVGANISQSKIANLVTDLANKAPGTHFHAQSDISGLSTTLAGKADLVAGKVPSSQLPDGLGGLSATASTFLEAAGTPAALAAIGAAPQALTQTVRSTSDMTLTTTVTDIPGLSTSVNSGGPTDEFVVDLSLDAEHATGANTVLVGTLWVDGSVVPSEAVFGANTYARQPINKRWRITGLTAGLHIFKIRAKIDSSSAASMTVWSTHSTMSISASPSVYQPATPDLTKLSGWGSSSMAGWATRLNTYAAARKGTYFNGAVGGWKSAEILANMGAEPAVIGAVTIPASGPVNVTSTLPADAAFSTLGTLNGVPGVLSQTPSNPTVFTRSSAGSTVAVLAGTPFIPSHGYQGGVALVNIGKNDLTFNDDLLTAKNATVKAYNYFTAASKPVLIIGHFIDTNTPAVDTSRDLINEYNTWAKDTYGNRFIDLKAYVTGSQIWTDTGITPNGTTDNSQQALGNKPPSLSLDDLHLNTVANNAVVAMIMARVVEVGWTTGVPIYAVDDFSRPDSTNLGSTPIGNRAWTESHNEYSIASDQLTMAGVTTLYGAAYIETGVTNYRVTGKLAAVGSTPATSGGGMVVRRVDINNTWYLSTRVSGGQSGYAFFKIVAGTLTQVGTYSTTPAAPGDVVTAEVNGSTFVGYVNGVEVARVTGDTAVSTGTKVGFLGHTAGTATRWDDFRVELI